VKVHRLHVRSKMKENNDKMKKLRPIHKKAFEDPLVTFF